MVDRVPVAVRHLQQSVVQQSAVRETILGPVPHTPRGAIIACRS
jgi:hypothetical protein